MLLMVTSHRGHHEANVGDVAVCEQIFNKLTGKTKEALPESFKCIVPPEFSEIKMLWTNGTMNYTAIAKDSQGETTIVKDFTPNVQEVAFLAPIVGG